MKTTALIACGGALGASLRYWVHIATHKITGHSFPYGTLVVNISGCFLIGLLSFLIFERYSTLSEQLKALLIIGLLGGFTTMSSFSLETLALIEKGSLLPAAFNMFATLLLCLLSTWLGLTISKVIYAV